MPKGSHRVAVFHPLLSVGGGAEAVAAAIVQDLVLEGCSVTLYTAERPAAARRGLEMLSPDVEHASVEIPATRTSAVLARLGTKPPVLLAYSLLMRELRQARIERDLDLVLSTFAESDIGRAGRRGCYVHYPVLSKSTVDTNRVGGRLVGHQRLRTAYTRACRSTAGYCCLGSADLVMTNSHWTKSNIERAEPEARPTVLYPPVVPFAVPVRAGSDRPEVLLTVLSLGRLVPYKGQREIIAALDSAAQAVDGRAVAIFAGRGGAREALELQSLATQRVDVEVYRNVERAGIGKLVGRADLGATAFRNEHFGMAAAELEASGLPVVTPVGGGQQEASSSRDLVFNTPQELAAIFARAMTQTDFLHQVRSHRESSGQRFGRQRFREEFTALVSEYLSQAGH